MAGLNRRLEAKTLNQPVLVVESAKFFQGPNQFRYRLKGPDPQQLLLERPEEAFDTAVAFRLANKRRRRLDSQEGEFVLEVIAHELRTVIVPESESFGGAAPEAAEVLTDTLAEGFESLEARGTLDGMNAHTLGCAMGNGGEDGDLAVASMTHIRLGRSVVMIPLWILAVTGTAWRWGASNWACRIRRSTRAFEVRTPANRRRAHTFR